MPAALDRLQQSLSRLPGIGRRSAERIALRLVQDAGGQLSRDLRSALDDVARDIRLCGRCGYVTSRDQDPCPICVDEARDDRLLCLVEDVADITLLETARAFRGRYFCLLGKISPQSGRTLTEQRLAQLNQRLGEGVVEEVLLALNADVESDATTAYLQEYLALQGVRVTRLALGIPAGSGIAYTDPVTLARAVQGRTELGGGE